MQFLFKLMDSLFFYFLGVFVLSGKGSCSFFKKLLLPTIECIRLQLVFIAKIRYRFPTNQVALEDDHLLFRAVIVTLLSHGLASVHDWFIINSSKVLFPLNQDSRHRPAQKTRGQNRN